jgi:hypothetical protein
MKNVFYCVLILSLIVVLSFGCGSKFNITKDFVRIYYIQGRTAFYISKINVQSWKDSIPFSYKETTTIVYGCEEDLRKDNIVIYFNRQNTCKWGVVKELDGMVTFPNKNEYLFPIKFKKDEWYSLRYDIQFDYVFKMLEDSSINFFQVRRSVNF